MANGQDAGLAGESVVRSGLTQSEREKTKKALRDHGGQDMLAPVRLFEELRRHVRLILACQLGGQVSLQLCEGSITLTLNSLDLRL